MKIAGCILTFLLLSFYVSENDASAHYEIEERSIFDQLNTLGALVDCLNRMDLPGLIFNAVRLTRDFSLPWYIKYPLEAFSELAQITKPLYYWLFPNTKPKNYKRVPFTQLLPKHAAVFT